MEKGPFDRTYEGLKLILRHHMASPPLLTFDRTYEGLKRWKLPESCLR